MTWLGTIDSSHNQVFLYNGTTTVPLGSPVARAGYADPRISGSKVVWADAPGIYLYDAATNTTQLLPNSLGATNPQILGSSVVWSSAVGSDPNNQQIFLYNGTTTTQLTNNGSHSTSTSPQVFGSRVVWDGVNPNSNGWQIYLYDGVSTTQLTSAHAANAYPQISGSIVAWQGWDGTAEQIYLYDGTATTQVSHGTKDSSQLEVSGPDMVWVANRQIFLATPVPEPSTLIVWLLLGASGVAIGWWRRKRKA